MCCPHPPNITPGDFLKAIAQKDTAPRYLIIMGHRGPDGLWFGNYPEIDTPMLKGECLPAEAIRQHVQLAGCTIIATCCFGGIDEMAEAFLSQGARGYIGSSQGIGGAAMNLFMVNFMYRTLVKNLSEDEAVKQAIEATGPESASIRYFGGK